MPEDERLEAISEALARLIRRQDERQQEIDARFARIEAALGIHAAPPPVVVAAPPPIPQVVPPPIQHQPPPPMPPALPLAPPPSEGLEARIGLNWINIIGVVTLIFGAAFFFKYAVDNNWVGPTARVALGIVAAMLALFFGDLTWRRGQKVFGQGITGLGLALLYLSFWAAFGIYHLIPQPAAFLLMVLTTAASVVFAMRYESQIIALLGMLAGYWTPGALSTGEPHPWILFSYVFLLNLGGLTLTRLRRWPAMEILSAIATILWYGAWLGFSAGASDHEVATIFALAFYAQFCFARARLVWALAQVAGPLAILNIWNAPDRFLPLLFVYAAGGLVVAEIRLWTEAPAWALTCYWSVYFFWTAVMEKPGASPELQFAYITGAFAIFFLWVIWWAVIRKRILRNTDLLVMVVNAAAYFGASYYLLNPNYHAYMGLFSALLGGLNLMLAKLVWNPEAAKERDTWPALLAVAVTLTFLTLAVPIQFAGFRITFAWALEGAALAWISARFQSVRMSIGAGIVLVLAVMRLFMVDTVFYAGQKDFPLFVNERFLTFAVTAIGLFVAAKFFSQRSGALVSYVAGHVVTLAALGLELVSWIQRSVAPADQFETITVSISILMAFYGLMLITLGVVTKSSINRVLGLLLMTLVVIKLYLSDVWELGYLFKIVAFVGLGVLLLSVSYLYSRFRPAIEKLWKDDPSA
ncbi:MAG TPA: DUF2339 domain-containing protein [Bryobacteraceae bacterium]|jgi:uncharacterized membrane protein|nr:DUF2339 domain-containing protein [Bryobacteraceae bacterium]